MVFGLQLKRPVTERNGTVRFTVPVLDATNGTVKMTGTAAAKKRIKKRSLTVYLSQLFPIINRLSTAPFLIKTVR